jgi:hypothetical protein
MSSMIIYLGLRADFINLNLWLICGSLLSLSPVHTALF